MPELSSCKQLPMLPLLPPTGAQTYSWQLPARVALLDYIFFTALAQGTENQHHHYVNLQLPVAVTLAIKALTKTIHSPRRMQQP